MKTLKPNYDECITNLSNSILKYFNIETYHKTLPYIDKILDKNYRNVIVILCDGMGSKILDEVLDKDSFLIKNRKKIITTVFPPTTTAATTSILTGLNPNEHGWLGWDMYFKEEDKIVTMFLNTIKDTKIKAADYNISKKTFPYENIISKITMVSKAYGIYSFQDEKYHKFSNIIDEIIKLTKTNDKKYIYAYYDNPDSLLHDMGINSDEVKKEIKYINDSIEDMYSKIDDSVVIVVADHGHIDCEYYNLDDYPSVKCLLKRTTSLEPRAVSFYVLDDKKDLFIKEFNKYFKNDFILYTNKEIIKNKIFGTGKNNVHFNESIGDFVAIAKTNKCIIYSNKSEKLKSTHAGLTEREMLIPLIIKEIK